MGLSMAFVLVSTLSVSFLRLPGAKQVCAIYTSDVCVGHNPGPTHPEKPARLRQLLHALRTEWVPEIGSAWLDVRDPPGADVTDEQVARLRVLLESWLPHPQPAPHMAASACASRPPARYASSSAKSAARLP